ncbi:MAG: class I SAM-dependent RNA methyltransferase [Fibrobacteraceae bacterium]|jgi:23S rRNA (uracil1939-C5)-methyltransferase|nr:class I SAM-dependent RNA methyltransferase [Fibrobacteraceae bacterium]
MLEKEIILKIEKAAQGGDGFSHLQDGRACFVQGALPGETVLAKITNNGKDFAKAITLKVLEKNPLRESPRCPFYERCGGCSLQHASLSLQISMAREAICDTFRRFAHITLPENFPIHFGNPWEYRNRIRVLKTRDAFGFREGASHHIIPVASKCKVLVPALQKFLESQEALSLKTKELQVFENGNGAISYFYKGMSQKEFLEKANTSVEIAGKKIYTDASVFFQSNLSLLPVLVKRVKEVTEPNTLLVDLFSGVGFFAALLEDSFEKIVAVERDANCLRLANKNLKASATFVSEPAEDWLGKNIVSNDVSLIVDPPRTGLPQSAADALCKSALSRLIYVSCNPVTLARDVSLLAKNGFTLDLLEGFAFYPQTPHLEMLAVLRR